MIRLLALLCLCLTSLACQSGAKPDARAAHRTEARELFGKHREALPRFASSIPMPLEAKYWPYSVALEYPDHAACVAELLAELEQQSTQERAMRCAMLRRLGETPPETVEAALLERVESFLQGEDVEAEVPPLDTLELWLQAYFAEKSPNDIAAWLLETQAFADLDTTTPMERTDLSFEAYVRVQRDFRRLQFVDALIEHWQIASLKMQLRPIATDTASSLAMRMEAARTLYALGEVEEMRPVLLYLGFGQQAAVPLYGWPTYAFLASHQDPGLYSQLRDQLAAASVAERPQYLVQLAAYGKPEDFETLATWIKAGLPQLPEQRIGPDIDPATEPPTTSRVPSPALEIQLAQDAAPPENAGSGVVSDGPEEPPVDPHHDLTAEDFAGAFGYETADVNAAMRLRLLRHFEASNTLPLLHEALLKSGPATRIAAAELLAERGSEESLEMLRLTWADEADPMVLAELAYAWLMIDKRLSSTD